MLAKKKRFTRSEFAAFLDSDSILQVYNTIGTAKFHPAEALKVAVVTSGKHQKKAVLRNRLRRRLYAIFQKEDAQSPLFFHVVLYLSKASYTFSYGEIEQKAKELIERNKRVSK